jgi:hypothetical protein
MAESVRRDLSSIGSIPHIPGVVILESRGVLGDTGAHVKRDRSRTDAQLE